jgi:hypothetical protein
VLLQGLQQCSAVLGLQVSFQEPGASSDSGSTGSSSNSSSVQLAGRAVDVVKQQLPALANISSVTLKDLPLPVDTSLAAAADAVDSRIVNAPSNKVHTDFPRKCSYSFGWFCFTCTAMPSGFLLRM